jgi:hypothetical protein
VSWPGKLTPWLRKIFFSEEEQKNGQLSRLELRRMSAGSPESCVETWRFDEDSPKTNADLLSQEICQRCQDDSDESLDHVTKYIVMAYYEDYEFSSSQSPPALFRSMRQGDDFEGSEPPTQKGLTTQLMRHTEGLTRLLVANTAQTQAHGERMLTAAFKRIEELENDKLEAIRLVEQISNDTHTREIEMKREVAKIGRQQEAWESFKVLAPTIVNKIAGKHLLPQKITPKDEILHTLIASITPDQFETLKSLLKPPQLIGFMELYQIEAEEADRRKAEEEKKRKEMADALERGGQNGGAN